MILIDTHIWVWWVSESKRLTLDLQESLLNNIQGGIGVSVISCWEVANLVERNRIRLGRSVRDWVSIALGYPGVQLMDMTPEIAVTSTQLPGDFHRDPADRILVATARIYQIPLLTVDELIQAYPHVQKVQH